MPWFEISLIAKKNISQAKYKKEVINWANSLERFEHILDDSADYWKSRYNFVLHIEATRIDSLFTKYFNQYVLKNYQQVIKSSQANPMITLLEYKPNKKEGDLKTAKELFLISNIHNQGPCVRHGDNGRDIPIYLLPMDPLECESIRFWAWKYREHEMIEIRCGKLEIPAYKQIALLKSDLTKEGRELCKEIELATGKPTYYYMFRYWGWKNKKKEFHRPCPSCGKPWRNKKITTFGINSFHFKCKPCRLVSNESVDFDNEKYAQIGYSK
jgi:predicted  nucleic acid-binding Zn ribbon protein